MIFQTTILSKPNRTLIETLIEPIEVSRETLVAPGLASLSSERMFILSWLFAWDFYRSGLWVSGLGRAKWLAPYSSLYRPLLKEPYSNCKGNLIGSGVEGFRGFVAQSLPQRTQGSWGL